VEERYEQKMYRRRDEIDLMMVRMMEEWME
jgi:hypothetical protein